MEFTVSKKGYSPKEVEEYIAAVKREYEATIVKQRDRIKSLLEDKEKSERELAAYRAKTSQISKAIMNAVAKAEEIDRLSKLKYSQEITRLKAFHEKWTKYYEKIMDEYPLDSRLAAVGEFNRRMDKILARVGVADETAAAKPGTKSDGVRIGYISVNADEPANDTAMSDLLPGADLSSPVLTGDFDPMERIGKYFAAEKEKQEKENREKALKTKSVNVKPAAETAASVSAPQKDYADRSPSGFSFEEALNPTEDLEDILKDLGLFSCD